MENENESRQNNFTLLRFVAASLVIISHSFSLLKYHKLDFLGGLGVTIFFIISGYLITQSWVHSPNPAKFIKKRLLRILPGLGFCTLVTMSIIGPLTTSLPLSNYFSDIHTWSYLTNILLYPLQFTLPGVFDTNSTHHLVNHSLWTLPVEFTAYLLIVLLGLFKLVKKRFIVIGVLVLILANAYLHGFSWYRGISFYNFSIVSIVPYVIYFFIGSAILLLKIKIRFNIFLFICALILFVFTLTSRSFLYSYFVAIPYMVFSIAFLSKKFPFLKKTDPSYGMYLFSMPIQQTIIHFFPKIDPWMLLLFSFTATLPLAYISWHVIESKFLLLKKRL